MSFFIHRTKIKDESERLRLYCYTLSIAALEDNIIISYGNHVIFLDRTGSYNGLYDKFSFINSINLSHIYLSYFLYSLLYLTLVNYF